MTHKLITSILLLLLVWPAHYTYAVENDWLRPVAAGERDEDADLELEIEIRILLASTDGIWELYRKFEDGTFGRDEWLITLRILYDSFYIEGSTIVSRFEELLERFEAIHQMIISRLMRMGDNEGAKYIDESFNALAIPFVAAHRRHDPRLRSLPAEQLPPQKPEDDSSSQI